MSKEVILTGIRANNDLQLGNYFGAILPIIEMAKRHSDEYQINLFVPDLHSFTTPIDHASLQRQILHTVKIFAAAGLPLDKPNIYIYRQSYITAHSELTWILDCFTGFGEMNRMTQFKDKSDKLSDDRVSMGLFNYPVLMAADILLYGASYIPVGDDQTQHIEFTRDIAERLNNQFGPLFVIPKAVKEQYRFFGGEAGLRIKDLIEPTKKMSKSDELGKGVIYLGDTPEAAGKKVMAGTTDSVGTINLDPLNQPGITNLLQIHALLNDRSLDSVTKEFSGSTAYGELKQAVATALADFLTSFQAKLKAVDETEVLRKLEESEIAMKQQADQTLLRVQRAVGLRP